MEMTREELQLFIRDTVNRRLVSENEWEKCRQLQSLWERREKLSTDLIKYSEAVFKCEAIVKQLYSKLGWEYEDTEEIKCTDMVSNSGATADDTDDVRSASSISNDVTTANSDEEYSEGSTEVSSKTPEERFKLELPQRVLRVTLERLPMNLRPRHCPKPSSPKPSISKRSMSDDELSNVDSDYLPSECSSDSDFSVTNTKSDKQKKKKMIKLEKSVKTDAKEVPVSQPVMVVVVPPMVQTKPVTPLRPILPALAVQPTKSEPATNGNDTNRASTSEAAPNLKVEVKTEAKPFAINDKKKPAQAPSSVPQEPVVGLNVLARRKKIWEPGKIAEIVAKEDGTKKYKILFEDNGKVLVSGHHIAYDTLPKLVQLSVGGRVVARLKPEHTFYSQGVLGELPSRKNHMRFLIFFDDQKTLYVALPVLRVVCKPLPDPLDDIRNEEHKSFMREYLQRMPYPPHTQFRVSQKIKVLRDGALESCTVLQLDCSLMEVVYDKDEEKEWIYRGSIRLEHIMNMKDQSKK